METRQSLISKIRLIGLFTILFITLKLLNKISWSWLWVLSPLLISAFIIIAIVIVIIIFTIITTIYTIDDT